MQVAATDYAKKKVLGRVGERVHQNKPNFETDPEIIAATQEAAAKQTHHWWKKDKKFTPDMLLSKRDQKILHSVKSRAWYLDKGFHCCCFQVGLDGIVGLIPGIGDFIGTAFAVQLVKTASKADLPKELIAKMMMNVLVDFMIGLTPIAGDILDIMFKCNWRNAMLLEEYLILRRRDEIRLEKGEAAANALMGHDVIQGGTDKKALPSSASIPGGKSSHHQASSSSSTTGPTKPQPVHHNQNNMVTPIITEVDDDGNEIVDPDATTKTTVADNKKKYGTFFGRWRS